MALPNQPVTLTPGQVDELNRKLANFRHSLNNHLALIIAATELLRRKPEMSVRMADTLAEPPRKIMEEIQRFSAEIETAFGITHD